MKNNFDHIATHYQRLSRAVFGNLLIQAQGHFLERIPSGARVLVAGGGDGEILRHLAALDRNLSVHFLDASFSMLELARMKYSGGDQVTFIHQDIKEWHPDTSFDVIITAFFLDCFSDDSLSVILPGLKGMLSKGGCWLFTDFMPASSYRHRLLTGLMYWFFRLTTGLEAGRLPEYDRHFENTGMNCEASASWKNGLIESRIYRLA